MNQIRSLAVALLLAISTSAALGGSTINPNNPAQNSNLTSSVLRSNFAAAYNDINNILSGYAGTTAPGSPTVFQDWLDTATTPATWKKRYSSGWGAIGTFNTSTGAFVVSGSIGCVAMPAFTGDVTKPSASCVTTLATAQPDAHTWAAVQTFTLAPVFTDASGSRTALGLGTAAVQNIGTSGANVPLLSTANTWTLGQTFSAAMTYGGVTLANAVTGTGNMVLATGPTVSALTVTGSFTATGLVGNAALVNAATTVNGTICTLGSTCTAAAAAGTLTGATLAAGVTASSLTSVGALGGGSATTGFTIAASNVTWSGTVPGVNVATAANASGAPSATFGVVKCDGTTITCSSGVITSIGGAATDVSVGVTTVTSGGNTKILYDNSGILGAYTISGTGTVVCMVTSCTMVTPTLGVAAATSINKVAITAPATSATLTIADGKVATVSNTLTFTGTDSSSVAFGAGGTVTYTIATGTKALATSAISSAACSSAQTDTATGAATTDDVDATFASDPTAVTGYVPLTSGMLTIISYVTSNTVNFKVCNNTAASITPGAMSLNWRVRR